MRFPSRGAAVLAAALSAAVAFAQDGAPRANAAGDATGTAVGVRAQGSGVAGFSFEELSQVPEGRTLLAATTPDYPVTPGDSYTLAFLQQAQPTTLTLIVDTDFLVNLGVFGIVPARGLSFPAFRRSVEARVAAAYPGSSPVLSIRSTGVFEVLVRGEVTAARSIQSWGLARVSSLLEANRTSYTSTRDVRVQAGDGSQKRLDLFRAQRYGDLTQDPYLRPLDQVTFTRADRIVSIAGQVRRPGSYELLPGESLKDVVETYGDGFTAIANPAGLKLTRYVSSGSFPGEKLSVNYGTQSTMPVMNLDAFTVPSAQELLPVAWFEGAIGVGINGEDPQAARRVPYPFFPGEGLSDAVRALRSQFSAVSDLERAYVLRSGGRLPVDIARFLNGSEPPGDFPLDPGDIIIVPFRQFFVSVAGAVKIPGRYPYVPDRTWAYYVNLAGGIDRDRNAGDQLTITDLQGKIHGKEEPIRPESMIVVASNSPLHVLGQLSAIFGTGVAIAALIISLFR